MRKIEKVNPPLPRKIHYVWLGKEPLQPLAQRCLASWRKYLPDWEIKKWDESNSPMNHPFVARMLQDRKYAFASDYIRLHALAEQGGLYLDTDMELVGDVEPLLNYSCVLAFLSTQNRPSKNSAALGFLATVPAHPWIEELKSLYKGKRKAVMNTTLATASLQHRGLRGLKNESPDCAFWDLGDIRIYHSDFFYPSTERDPVHQILGVHHAEGSWSGQATPLPWWRRLIDLRIDRKILRPLEKVLKKLRS
jgi:hypothetical protein